MKDRLIRIVTVIIVFVAMIITWFSININNLKFVELGDYALATSDANLIVTKEINNKSLTSDITLTASDVGALPDSTTIPSGSSTSPAMDGTAAAGSETTWAHGDHVHPTDTSRQAKITASGLLKGDGSGGVTAATAGTDYLVTESDPTVPSWAKQPSKPSYTATEVGALPSTTTIPAYTSQLVNNSGYITTNDVAASILGLKIVQPGTTLYYNGSCACGFSLGPGVQNVTLNTTYFPNVGTCL